MQICANLRTYVCRSVQVCAQNVPIFINLCKIVHACPKLCKCVHRPRTSKGIFGNVAIFVQIGANRCLDFSKYLQDCASLCTDCANLCKSMYAELCKSVHISCRLVQICAKLCKPVHRSFKSVQIYVRMQICATAALADVLYIFRTWDRFARQPVPRQL